MSLLGGAFRGMAPALALSLLDPQLTWSEADTQGATKAGVAVNRGDGSSLDAFDLKRLHAYASSLVDYHLILDLVQPLARAYMAGRLPTSLSYGQAAILLCLGLQVGWEPWALAGGIYPHACMWLCPCGPPSMQAACQSVHAASVHLRLGLGIACVPERGPR